MGRGLTKLLLGREQSTRGSTVSLGNRTICPLSFLVFPLEQCHFLLPCHFLVSQKADRETSGFTANKVHGLVSVSAVDHLLSCLDCQEEHLHH